MVRITSDPIDPHGAYDMIASKSAGSVLIHYAVVKAQEGEEGITCHIDYSLSGNGEEELQAITDEIVGSLGIEDLLLIRRIGRVNVGEIISLIAVSSPSSEDAFAACKFGITRLKKMRSIVKSEVSG